MSIEAEASIRVARRRENEEALQQAMGHIVPHELKGMVPAIDAELDELRNGENSARLAQFIAYAEGALDRIEKALDESFHDTPRRGFEETINYARTKVSPLFSRLERMAQKAREGFTPESSDYKHIDLVRYHCNRGAFYVEGITRLIANLSSYFDSDAPSPNRKLQRDLINFRELVFRVERRLSRTSRDKASFEVIRSPSLPTIRGDEALLYLVMRNLISNSVKYGYAGRRPIVTVRPYDLPSDDLDDAARQVLAAHETYLIEQLDGRTPLEVREILAQRQNVTRIAVIDNGRGIPKRARGKVFRPFNRGSLERVPERADHLSLLDRGLGVGLTAVEWAMRMHGGFVTVGSVPDVGSVFVLAFPKERVYFERS